MEKVDSWGKELLMFFARHVGTMFLLFSVSSIIMFIIGVVCCGKKDNDKDKWGRFFQWSGFFFALYAILVSLSSLAFNVQRENIPDNDETEFESEQEQQNPDIFDISGVSHDFLTASPDNYDDWEVDNIVSSLIINEQDTYEVRLFIEEKDEEGQNLTGDGVDVLFHFPQVIDTESRLDGYITYGNDSKNRFYDSVVFEGKKGDKIYLDYIEGSARLKKTLTNKEVKLGDEVVSEGIHLSSEALRWESVDGTLNEKGKSYISILVKPVSEKSSLEVSVRKKGDKEWKSSVDAEVGEQIEYQVGYTNLNACTVDNVIIRVSLPDNLSYIDGTTQLFNTNHPNGAMNAGEETLCTSGVNIGDYNVRGNGYVRFTAEVRDSSLTYNTNRLILWAKATANGFATQASADAYVLKR